MLVQQKDTAKLSFLDVELIRNLPSRLRWIILLQNALVPYAFYIIATANSAPAMSYMLAAWLGMWICGSVVVGVALRTKRAWQAYSLGLALSISFSCVWLLVSDTWFPAAAFPLLMLIVVFRIHRSLSVSFVGDQNKAAFWMEGGIMMLGLFVCAGITGPSAPAFAWVCVNGLLAMMTRLYTMWSIERAKTPSEARSAITWCWLIACLLVVVGLGPKISYYLLFATAFVIGVVMSPIALLLPDWNYYGSLYATDNSSDNGTQGNPPPFWNKTVVIHHPTLIGWAVITLVVLAIVILGLILAREVRRRTATDRVWSQVIIARRWLGGLDDLQLLTTHHPVRLRFQRWLRKQDEQGNRIQPHETATQFIQRTRDERPDEVNPDTQELQERYQDVRYRPMDE